MQKKTYNDVQLNCVFQHVTDLPDELCLTGIISSLVRMVNGKYQMHAKTMRLEPGFDPSAIAFGFYNDVREALSIIE